MFQMKLGLFRNFGLGQRFFWVLASFSLSHRALRPCSFAQASPQPKIPRCRTATVFHKNPKFGLILPSPGDFELFLPTISPALKHARVKLAIFKQNWPSW